MFYQKNTEFYFFKNMLIKKLNRNNNNFNYEVLNYKHLKY